MELDLNIPEEQPEEKFELAVLPSIQELMASDNMTKDGIAEIVASILSTITEEDAIKTGANIAAAKEFIDQLHKGLRPVVLKATQQLKHDDRRQQGFDFVVSSTATTYMYDHDPRWVELKQEITDLEEQIAKDYGDDLDAAKTKLSDYEKVMLKYAGAKNVVGDADHGQVHGAKVKSAGREYVQIKFPPKKKK